MLLEDNLRSTKKVRIRTDGVDEEAVTKLAESNSRMIVEEPAEGVSYRNKLINKDHIGVQGSKLNEVVLSEEDYCVKQEGDIPCIDFSTTVREALTKGMERTLVIKLLGRYITYQDLRARTTALWQLKGSFSLVDMEGGFYYANFDLMEDYIKALSGGPWTIFGAYLTVQPWSLEFDPKSSTISKVVIWVRIPGLSFRYYHKSMLRAIGSLLGEVVKIDYRTETMGRGKYARIAVLVDLIRPLIPWIKVDGKFYGVEYEGLPLICFECGRYGHTKEKCQRGKLIDTAGPSQELRGRNAESGSSKVDMAHHITADDGTIQANAPPYGSWMQAQQPSSMDLDAAQTNQDGPQSGQRQSSIGVGSTSSRIEHSESAIAKSHSRQAVETPSSLDATKHTVMEIPRDRPPLALLKPTIRDPGTMADTHVDVQGDRAAGKENRVDGHSTVKKSGNGVKLQSNLSRALKIRKKQTG
ncbi:hypothetical protein K1719_033733 [Acacia pycnantha]|nr:hypothetical protein K1719_033733 [Acacia pycnantha]